MFEKRSLLIEWKTRGMELLEWAHVSPPLFHTYEELPFVWETIKGEEFLKNRHN